MRPTTTGDVHTAEQCWQCVPRQSLGRSSPLHWRACCSLSRSGCRCHPISTPEIAPVFVKVLRRAAITPPTEGRVGAGKLCQLLAGGKHGAEVDSGACRQSRLVRVLTGKAEAAMPPEEKTSRSPKRDRAYQAVGRGGAKGPQGAALDPTRLVAPKVAATAAGPRGDQCRGLRAPTGIGSRWLAMAGWNCSTRRIASGADARRGARQCERCGFSADGGQVVAAAGEAGLFGEARLWNVADG